MLKIELLVVYIAWLCVVANGLITKGSMECPARENRYQSPHGDNEALTSLLHTARLTRESIVRSDLPYVEIRNEINKVYNHSVLSVDMFVGLWINYSLDYIYLSGAVLFVGVVIPILVLGLWALWHCCRESDQNHNDEDNTRRHTRCSQGVIWSLAVSIFLLLFLLCVFVALLLAGNTRLSSGVHRGGDTVGGVLLALAEVRDNALKQVNRLLIEEYAELRQSVEEDVLSMVGPDVVSNVRATTQDQADSFYSTLYTELQLSTMLRNYTKSILLALSKTQLLSLLDTLNSSLRELQTSCNIICNSTILVNSSVCVKCENVTVLSDDMLYLQLRENIGGAVNSDSLLEELDRLLTIPVDRSNSYDIYLDSMLLPQLINSTLDITRAHIGPSSLLGQNIFAFLQQTVHYYNSTLTFDLPESQERLNELLGTHYLTNWEDIRNACTLTFALVVLLLGVCLLVPIGCGLFSMHSRGGDELSDLEVVHQAGTALKKVSFSLLGVSLLTALCFGFFLTLAGPMGRSCGHHGNFSDLLSNVVDHSESWTGSYPLGWALIRNSSYPLTVADLLKSCRDNNSLYEALQLSAREDLNLAEISFSMDERNSYESEMRAIANNFPAFTPLTPSQASLLSHLHNASSLPIQWVELQNLTIDGVFDEEFIGATRLQQIIASINFSVHEMMTFEENGINTITLSAILSSIDHALSKLVAHIDMEVVPVVNVMALNLENKLKMSRAAQLLENESLREVVVGNSTTLARRELSVTLHEIAQQTCHFTISTRQNLHCDTGSCVSLARLFDQFSLAFCEEVVPGLDIFWTTSLAMLVLSLLIFSLSLLLATRLIDPELKEGLSKKFNYWSSLFRQLRAFVWLVFSLGICLWFVISVAMDKFFLTMFCENRGPGCCVQCVWAMGVVFLVLATLVGGASRVYQCVIIYRITQCAHSKVKRFWVNKKKAIQFYSQLLILLLQDVPFLILAGVYVTPPNTLTLPPLFTIIVSLAGILAYILYLLIERNSITVYFTWLKKTVFVSTCCKKGSLEIAPLEANGGIPMTNRRRLPGRYGSSESDQSDDSQGTYQQDENGQYATTTNHRLSNIPEQPEGVELPSRAPPHLSPSPPQAPSSPQGGVLPPPIRVPHLDDNVSYSEMSQPQPSTAVALDHLNPSDESALALRRQAALDSTGGVEIAPRNFAASTMSDFGSDYTMSEYPGYFSSQPVDDDYRDDYSDSDYSQLHSQRGRRALRLGRAIGEVSMDV